jgi:phosphoglycerate dehydrogenase-like enzyme
MSRRISVLSQVSLPPSAQQAISDFAGDVISFPHDTPVSEAELVARTGDAEAILIGLGAARRVAFANVVDYGDEPTAEFIFTQLVMLMRGIAKYQWKDAPRELMGKSLTIIGLGAVGGAIAHLAVAYKMQVNYYSRRRKHDWEKRGLQFGELRDLLPRSDIVVISVPTNAKVLGAAEFAIMKPGAVIVQASMGDTFEKEAFLDWIAQRGNFAILDYAAGEQNYLTYKDLPRVIFPRTVAGHTQETIERLGQKVFETYGRILRSPGSRASVGAEGRARARPAGLVADSTLSRRLLVDGGGAPWGWGWKFGCWVRWRSTLVGWCWGWGCRSGRRCWPRWRSMWVGWWPGRR